VKAGIIDSCDRADFWERALGSEFECVIASDPKELSDCRILFVSEEYCGGATDAVMDNILSSEKLRSIPAAAVTSDGSCENQELLCAFGFDDVICLPMCRELILRRARALCAMYPCVRGDRSFSFERLVSLTDEKDPGAYFVRSADFSNIYRFVLRVLERTGKNAQMLVMTLSSNEDHRRASYKSAMDTLSEAVRLCLRRGDMSSVCGSDQVLVLLIGADDEGGHLAANRIVSSFYNECSDDSFELTYDIREIHSAV